MRLRGLPEAAAVASCALALTALLTYPLLFKLDHVGRLNTDDGRWSIWVVSWVAHALTTNPAGVYDANIFYPNRSTLAYSEANLGAGVVAAPVWLATKNPYTTHNVVAVLSFVFAAVGAYYLVRHLTSNRYAAAVAAVMYAFCPFAFARTAHIQLMLTGGMPVCLLAFHRIVARPTVFRSVVLGVALWAQALSCAYYGVFAGLMVGLGSLWFGVSRGLWRNTEYVVGIGLAAFVCIGLTIPFFVPYIVVQQTLGFARTLEESRVYSADLGAWFASSAWAHRWWLPMLGEWNEVLFPGILVTVFGAIGLWLGLRRREARVMSHVPTDVVLFYATIVAITVWASFGPDAGLYKALYDWIPLFSFLRAPSRMGIMATLGLTVLASFTVKTMVMRLPSRKGAFTTALVVITAAELMTAPLSGMRDAPPLPQSYRVLADLPTGPVAEFPYFYRRADFPRHAIYMLNSTAHWQPLINGYSDHIPQDFRDHVTALSGFPSREAFRVLGQAGARYVVFHLDLYDSRSRERLQERLVTYGRYLRPVMQEERTLLFEIIDWPN